MNQMQGFEDVVAEIESDFRRRLINNCYSKCIDPKYHSDGELNKGESVCLDRCVSKFMLTNTLIEKVSNEVGNNLARQMGMEVPPQ
ncbi:protein transporter tim10 [Blyttiomyces sp. JEL0837]|nr:protein transporter tim10 [Blyttiomyces sp. JEL0837]